MKCSCGICDCMYVCMSVSMEPSALILDNDVLELFCRLAQMTQPKYINEEMYDIKILKTTQMCLYVPCHIITKPLNCDMWDQQNVKCIRYIFNAV